MSFDENKLSYYIFKDLRASQNNNYKEGFQVVRFDSLPKAISAFRLLPADWTSSLGVKVSANSEIDLVQRREGEPVLSGDYQRIPAFYGNPDVQAAVRTLLKELNIQWQSEYRIFGNSPVLIPVVPDLDFVRDRAINGKHLYPDKPNVLFTAIQEMYTPENGWQDVKEIYDIAQKFGYNDPHVPKITTIHARYADEQGQIHSGDLTPYNYILLQERSKLMEQDKYVIKSISEAVEAYISRKDMDLYASFFGTADQFQASETGSFKRAKDIHAERLADLIRTRDLTPLTEPLVTIMERGLYTASERSEARELLGRVMNIPETGDKKLPFDLRMRASTILDDLYRGDQAPEKAVEPIKEAACENAR